MNKTVMVVIVVLLLLGGGGAAVMLANKGASPTPTVSSVAESNGEVKTGETNSLSMKELIGLGVSQECVFSDETGNGGLVYVTNGKTRGDFSTKTAEAQVDSHMIVDGQTVYMWMDNQTSGFKMSLDATAQGQTAEQGNVDVNKKVDFSCKSWSVDNSKFDLPNNIKFSDLSAMMAAPSGSGAPDMKATQCAACDSAPEDSRAQCRAALGCN